MLTKPQTFLRDVANQCFSQFCTEKIPAESLERLLQIVSTPNKQAGEFMMGEAEEKEAAEEDEGDAEEIESDESELFDDSD